MFVQLVSEGGLEAAIEAPFVYGALDSLAARARRWAEHRAEALQVGLGVCLSVHVCIRMHASPARVPFPCYPTPPPHMHASPSARLRACMVIGKLAAE